MILITFEMNLITSVSIVPLTKSTIDQNISLNVDYAHVPEDAQLIKLTITCSRKLLRSFDILPFSNILADDPRFKSCGI
jgi:hypothetical protein